MVCSEFFKLLDNYENLTESEKSDLNSHAAECDSCRDEFEFFRSITNTVSALPCPEPPQDLIARVNEQIDSMPNATGRINVFINNIKRNSFRYATVAACLAVGLVVGLNSKTIDRGLTHKDDGVISRTTITERTPKKPAHEAKPNEQKETKEGKKEEVATPKPEETAKPEVVEKPKNTVKTNANTAKKQTKSKPVASVTPKATAKPVMPGKNSEVPAINATEAPAVKPEKTEAPVQTETAVESDKEGKSTYTIAKGVYYIPETTEQPVQTEAPADEVEAYSLASGEYQIAIGYYDVPETKVKSRNNDNFTEQLIVSVNDVGTITTYMATLGAMNSGRGYQMSLDNFYKLLSILDTEGISYRYSSGVNTSDTIIFSIVTY